MREAVEPGRTRLGWIGLGVMGDPMCRHLIRVGYELRVHTRTRSRAGRCLAEGALWCDSPFEVASGSDVVFTMLGYPEDVRRVVLEDAGVLQGLREGGAVVDMTTSEPALAEEIANAAGETGRHALDAPVSGGDVGAREARLSIMVGGETAAVEALRPAFETLGKTIVHQGGPGAGQRAKLANQVLIAANMIGVCEALVFAVRAGLDAERLLASVSGGAAGSWSLLNLGPRMLAGDYAPGFYVEHFVKDLRLALAEARRLQLDLPGLALAESLYDGLVEEGGGRDGTQALIRAVAAAADLTWPPRRPST